MTLRDFFRVWGEPLSRHTLGSFTSHTRVRAYVAGRLVAGDPGAIALESGEQIVLEIGAYVAPHPSFLFPKGS
jgi:hypothetical protein